MSSGIKSFFFNPTLFLLFVASGLPTHASESLESSWDFEGQAIFDFRLEQKPSANNGLSTFSLPWLSLSAVREFEDKSELALEVFGATPVTNSIEIQFRRIALTVAEAVGSSTDLELGLIENGFFEIQSKYWPLRRLSSEMRFPLQRWGYLPDTDYGFQLRTLLGDKWTLGFQATNGEGRGQAETGPRKDFSLWMTTEWSGSDDRAWLISLLGVRGAHESVASELASKDRASLAIWSTRFEGWSASLAYDWAADPADAINGKVAEQVNLTSKGGERVQAQGYTGHLRYDWRSPDGKHWSIWTGSERWEPVKGEGDRAIQSSHLGLTYTPRPLLTWAIYNTQTSFANNHSTAPRDQQSWRLSVDFRFN